MTKVVFVIAPEGFKDIEYFTPKKILEDSGVSVVTSSLSKEAKGADGASINVDILLNDVDVSYDGIVFIGGQGAVVYFDNAKALELVKNYNNAGKVVGGICVGPVILGNAGVLDGKRATVFPSVKDKIMGRGAVYTGEKVSVDGNIVTGAGPEAAEEFGEKLLEKLKE